MLAQGSRATRARGEALWGPGGSTLGSVPKVGAAAGGRGLTLGACAQGPAVTSPDSELCRGQHMCARTHGHTRMRTHAHTDTHRTPRVCTDPGAHSGTHPQLPPNRPSHRLPQSTPSRPAGAQPGARGQSWACPSDPSPPGPQVPPAEPRELEEVLVVVGGRALEDEEAAEGPVPHPGNFAFYDTRASECPPASELGPLS